MQAAWRETNKGLSRSSRGKTSEGGRPVEGLSCARVQHPRSRACVTYTSFRVSCSLCGRQKRAKDYSPESFALTTQLLKSNFEHYTTWNLRRRILEHDFFLNSSPAQINDLLGQELLFTSTALRQHPKVYWIWNHRRWCLEHIPQSPAADNPSQWREAAWNKELFVVEKMLDADPRNCEQLYCCGWICLLKVCSASPRLELPSLRSCVSSNSSATIR